MPTRDFLVVNIGVGRNIVECIARLGESVSFVSAVGDDSIGQNLLSNLEHLGVVRYTTKCLHGVPLICLLDRTLPVF